MAMSYRLGKPAERLVQRQYGTEVQAGESVEHKENTRAPQAGLAK
jgi:hypothetical protein